MDLEYIQLHYPFLTCIRYSDTEYVCVIQNASDKLITFYDYGSLDSADEKKLFLEFGDIWWNESNRLIPINIFMRGQMEPFRYALKTVNTKDASVLFGPVTSLSDIIQKRVKRRQIQLVRRVD
jgi:hypothetical protein